MAIRSDQSSTNRKRRRCSTTRLLVWCAALYIVVRLLSFSHELGCDDSSNNNKRSRLSSFGSNAIQSDLLHSSSSSLVSGKDDDDDNSPSSHVHVLYGLSGNHTAFLSEFEVSLKSVLFHSPIRSSLTIHIMADQLAHDALSDIWIRSGLMSSEPSSAANTNEYASSWMTRHQITIRTYNVQSQISSWQTILSTHMPLNATKKMIKNYTVGAFFRLFAHTLPLSHPTTTIPHHLLYLDTDVALMANLNAIYALADPTVSFQWGHSQCSGFILLTVSKMAHLWTLLSTMNITTQKTELHHKYNDQLFLRAINRTYPSEVGVLPPPWDVHLANDGLWKGNLGDHRPMVGMLHLNGGGKSKESRFNTESNKLLVEGRHRGTWGMVDWFDRMSWGWLRFTLESLLGEGEGYAIRIDAVVV